MGAEAASSVEHVVNFPIRIATTVIAIAMPMVVMILGSNAMARIKMVVEVVTFVLPVLTAEKNA